MAVQGDDVSKRLVYRSPVWEEVFVWSPYLKIIPKKKAKVMNATCEAIFSNLDVLDASSHLLVCRLSAAAFSNTVWILASSSSGMAMLRDLAVGKTGRPEYTSVCIFRALYHLKTIG